MARWNKALFDHADAHVCVCVSVSWPWGCQTSCLPSPPPFRSLSPPPRTKHLLLDGELLLALSARQLTVHTCQVKTSVVSQEGAGLLQFRTRLSQRKWCFLLEDQNTTLWVLCTWTQREVELWPALTLHCPSCLSMWWFFIHLHWPHARSCSLFWGTFCAHA